MTLLLKNCSALLRGPEGYKLQKDTYIGIDKDSICYIGTAKPALAEGCAVKDMRGRLVMAGMVNAHGHTPMTLTRGVGGGLPLQDWLNNAIFPVEARMTPEDIKCGMAMGILEMLACGTTMVADMYDFPWAGGDVLMQSGMKANICRVGLAFSEEEEVPPNRFNECVDIVRNFNDPSGRVRADFCIHSEYLTNEKFVRRIAEANADLHAAVHIHVSETEKEQSECLDRHGKTPIAYLKDCGVLENKVYAAHCVWVSDEDLSIMKEKGVTIVHNPTSNMKLGSGFAPVKKALDLGINVALGTDGCASNDNLNIFEEMHLASLIHKGLAKDPTVLTASQLLDMATVSGARGLGRDDTGELAVGRKADIIALDLDCIHMIPCFDAANLLVYSAQGSDVRMTMVDGRILYEDGEYLTLDKEKIIYEFNKAVERLY